MTPARMLEGAGEWPVSYTHLRKALHPHFPQLDDLELTDYAVRVVNPDQKTAAKVRVLIEFSVTGDQDGEPTKFRTIGVNENIIDASWQALSDAFRYHLLKTSPEQAMPIG